MSSSLQTCLTLANGNEFAIRDPGDWREGNGPVPSPTTGPSPGSFGPTRCRSWG